MPGLSEHLWPISRIADAVEALGRCAGFSMRTADLPAPPAILVQAGQDAIGNWLEMAAEHLGLESQTVGASYADISAFIGRSAPSLCLVVEGNQPWLLPIVERGSRTIGVVGTDLSVHRVPVDAVRDLLCSRLEAGHATEVDELLDQARLPPRKRTAARRALLQDRFGATEIAGGWLLRPGAGVPFLQQLRQMRIGGYLAILVLLHAVQHTLTIGSWWLIGRGALTGRLETGWMIAWLMMLVTLVPLRMIAAWAQGRLAYGVGGALKQRLMVGAVRLDPQRIRLDGAGRLLGRVMESEAVESLAISGGFLGLSGLVEIVAAALVLSVGPSPFTQIVLFVGWLGVMGVLVARFFRRRRRWTAARVDMTHDMVERMVGHRTRLAQQGAARWHDGEDQSLSRYVDRSRAMDGTAASLSALMGRGWVIIGFAGLMPTLLAERGTSVSFAIGVAGVLLGARAIQKLYGALSFLADAVISWEQVAPLFKAATNDPEPGVPAQAIVAGAAQQVERKKGETLVEAHDLVYRYAGRGVPVLTGCNLTVRTGDRVLLEGASGCGKSTLASLMFGLRTPESGLLLFRGVDRKTLGSRGWRRRVVAAPQFHENHILTSSLAFNLLMGRRWPARPHDLREAEEVCRELGLGDLLDRMPSGLRQLVGETGWQLSHGERSRVYIARAILQQAELIILDESFAALDPETLETCVSCVDRRSSTLLVIAHP